jgi:hypothetical protein
MIGYAPSVEQEKTHLRNNKKKNIPRNTQNDIVAVHKIKQNERERNQGGKKDVK